MATAVGAGDILRTRAVKGNPIAIRMHDIDRDIGPGSDNLIFQRGLLNQRLCQGNSNPQKQKCQCRHRACAGWLMMPLSFVRN